jgi:hypothetical protein
MKLLCRSYCSGSGTRARRLLLLLLLLLLQVAARTAFMYLLPKVVGDLGPFVAVVIWVFGSICCPT